jgi:hypothetical protein
MLYIINMTFILLKSKSALTTARPQRTKCAATKGKFEWNEFVQKRKDMDKRRVEKIKDIGNTIDNIAKEEVESAKEMFHEYFPFADDIVGKMGKFKDGLGNRVKEDMKKCKCMTKDVVVSEEELAIEDDE